VNVKKILAKTSDAKRPSPQNVRNLAKARGKKVSPAVRQTADPESTGRFDEVLSIIEAARRHAYQAVNAELVNLYWQLGEYISKKIATAEWGDGVVEELAATIAREYPGMRGYTRPNLFRMRQFFEAYQGDKKVSPLVRQLPWTHHLIILGQAKPPATRAFYMLAAIDLQRCPPGTSPRSRRRTSAEFLEEVAGHSELTAVLTAQADRSITRQTSAYRPALQLIELLRSACWLSLEGDGTVRLPGFLFDMNRFFQALVSRFLHDHLAGYGSRGAPFEGCASNLDRASVQIGGPPSRPEARIPSDGLVRLGEMQVRVLRLGREDQVVAPRDFVQPAVGTNAGSGQAWAKARVFKVPGSQTKPLNGASCRPSMRRWRRASCRTRRCAHSVGWRRRPMRRLCCTWLRTRRGRNWSDCAAGTEAPLRRTRRGGRRRGRCGGGCFRAGW
jgi:predicted nuclease of restriction endonuclease-like (RecB) superfamily